jgi:hypothetical protein
VEPLLRRDQVAEVLGGLLASIWTPQVSSAE